MKSQLFSFSTVCTLVLKLYLCHSLGDQLLQLWPNRSLLGTSPKYWHQYIKSSLQQTLLMIEFTDKTPFPLHTALFHLHHSTKMIVTSVLIGHDSTTLHNLRPSDEVVQLSMSNWIFGDYLLSDDVVVKAFGSITHNSSQYTKKIQEEQLIDKFDSIKILGDQHYFSYSVLHFWNFLLDENLSLNLSIRDLSLVEDTMNCTTNYLEVNESHSFGLLRFCVKHSSFSIYSVGNMVQVTYTLQTTSHEKHHALLDYSVSDWGLVANIKPRGMTHANQLGLFTHQIGGALVYLLESVLVQSTKIHVLVVHPIHCTPSSVLAFDGPGVRSPRKTLSNRTHIMSSFQSFIQRLTRSSSSQLMNTCFLKYSSREQSSMQGAFYLSESFFFSSIESCVVFPCVTHVMTGLSLQFNITLIHMNYTSNGTLGCRFGGVSFVEMSAEVQGDTLCTQSGKNTYYQSVFSKSSSVFCVIYWYPHDMCIEYLCLFHTKHCQLYLRSLSTEFGLNLTYAHFEYPKFLRGKKIKYSSKTRYLTSMLHLFVNDRSCVVVQVRDKYTQLSGSLFRKATLCRTTFNFQFSEKSYVQYYITGNINSNTFEMQFAPNNVEELCYTTASLHNSSKHVVCEKFVRTTSHQVLPPFVSIHTLKQYTGSMYDIFLIMLRRKVNCWADFVIKRCTLFDSTSQCILPSFTDISGATHGKLGQKFPEDQLMQRFTSQVAHQASMGYPLHVSSEEDVFTLRLLTTVKSADSLQAGNISFHNDHIVGCFQFVFTQFQQDKLIKVYKKNEKLHLVVYFQPSTYHQFILAVWLHDIPVPQTTKPVVCTTSVQTHMKKRCHEINTKESHQDIKFILLYLEIEKERNDTKQTTQATSWIKAFTLCKEIGVHLPDVTSTSKLKKLLSLLEIIYPTRIIEAIFIGLLFNKLVSSAKYAACLGIKETK